MSKSRNLVVARVGDESLHQTWIFPKEARDWDIAISYYGNVVPEADEDTLFVEKDTGAKWDSIARFICSHRSIIDDYDYICFPDDDLMLNVHTMNELFRISRTYDLYISQPALSSDSYFTHPITLHSNMFTLRYTNYIEGMAPCIRSDYLKIILPIISDNYSGWGIDRIWALYMPQPIFKAAVIDAVVVKHTRPLMTGPMYKTLAKLDVDAKSELSKVYEQFNNVPMRRIVFGGIDKSSNKIGSFKSRILNIYSLIVLSSNVVEKRRIIYRTCATMLRRLFQETKAEQVRRR